MSIIQTPGRLSSQTNPEAKNIGLGVLKNKPFTVRALSSVFSLGTLWVLLSYVFGLQHL